MKALKVRPAMRDVVALADDLSVDKVSGFTFRSEEELLTLLDKMGQHLKASEQRIRNLERLFRGVAQASNFSITFDRGAGRTTRGPDGQTIKPIDIKNTKQIRSNFQIIQDLDRRLQVLDSIEAQYTGAFGGERNALSSNIRKMKAGYESQLKKALTVLRKIAKAHEPPEFAELLTKVMQNFYKQLKDKFSAAEQYVYVTQRSIDLPGATGEELVFNHYIEFSDLKNDAQDFVYGTYIIVFSATVNAKGQMKTYVQTLHKFRAPGTFKLGLQFTSEQSGTAKLAGLLAADNFVDLLERGKLPFTKDELDLTKFSSRAVIDNVDVDADTDTVTVVFTKAVDDSNLKTVTEKVISDLYRMLSGRTPNRLKYKTQKTRSGIYEAKFVLVVPAEADPSALTPQQLDRLSNEFGFDPQDIRALQSIRQRGH